MRTLGRLNGSEGLTRPRPRVCHSKPEGLEWKPYCKTISVRFEPICVG